MVRTRVRQFVGPPPDENVVRAAEQILEAARLGHIRCLAIVVVNPLLESEAIAVGSNHSSHQAVLFAALSKLRQDVLTKV